MKPNLINHIAFLSRTVKYAPLLALKMKVVKKVVLSTIDKVFVTMRKEILL